MAKRAKISSSDGCYKSWSWFYKSRSWFYNSVIRKNKSAIKKNYSATCEGNLPNHAHGMDFPLLARACIRIWFPEKSIHPFTHRMFSTDFHRSCLWRLAFPSVHTGGERLWRVRKTSLHTVKLLESRGKAALTPLTLWMVEKPSLHTQNNWLSVRNSHCVNGWMLFWR